jgi:hypothetical protein
VIGFTTLMSKHKLGHSYKATPSAMKRLPYKKGGLSWQGHFSTYAVLNYITASEIWSNKNAKGGLSSRGYFSTYVVFYYITAFEIWSNKTEGGFWWEWPYKTTVMAKLSIPF